MVFIDEYEAPNNRSYGQEFFTTVCLHILLRLQLKLKITIQATEFFGRDILPPLLKVVVI